MAKARNDRSKESAKPKVPHHTIESLEVTGGFLRGVKLEFADGLNCIIGGRGTGKTTVLELVRHVLDLMPDEKVSAARARQVKGIVQNNLGNGRVRLGVRTKHGMRYTAERPWNDTCRVLNDQGEPTAIAFERDLIFTADVYSQNEIEEIATNPRVQLDLLDRFVEEEIRRIDGELRKLKRELDQDASELLRLDHEISDLEENASEFPAVEEKLRALQQGAGPDAKLVNSAHARKALREKERKTLEALHADMHKTRSEIRSLASGLEQRLASRIDADLASGSNQDLFGNIARQLDELRALLDRTADEIVRKADSVDGAIAAQEQALAERHAKQEAEYRDLVAKLQEETGRATERTQLQQRFAELATARKELQLRQQERSNKELHREDLAAKLAALRDERYAQRKRVAEQLLGPLQPLIRVSVTQAGSRDAYRALLMDVLKGHGMKYAATVDRIVNAVSPEELYVIVLRSSFEQLSETAGLDEDKSKRVLETIRASGKLYELQTVELEDVPRIELQVGRDYKESSSLSTGQRCTTILPILLHESERPLLVDQPEDNLDNEYIYKSVVQSLAKAKGKRQLIFVTHNPNIPVLGDAERVFRLDFDGRQGKLTRAGTVDELKQDIEDLLEGGREAFLLRKQRYGH